MASNTETGHAINIANFKELHDDCSGFGLKYNPSNADLTPPKMKTLWMTVDTAHQALTKAIQDSKAPINEREILFASARYLVTRSLNFYKSTKATKSAKADAKGLADKFRGAKVKVKKLPDGTSDPNDVSKSHLSFVMKGDTFRQLVDFYESDVLYAPNEVDLTVAALRLVSDKMKSLNDGIGAIIEPVDTARIVRNQGLYAAGTGALDIAQACKDYVVGAFGATSAQAKLVKRIRFKRPKK
jgi:hypothetical protein